MGHIMENFIIYAENLSYFYILCIVVTFLAIVVTWSIDIPKANKNFDVYHKPLTVSKFMLNMFKFKVNVFFFFF